MSTNKKAKSVNPWGNYSIEIPEQETPNYRPSEFQTSELPQLQNSKIAELQQFESLQVQNSEPPKVQTSESPEGRNSVISTSQTFAIADSQTSELPQLQNSTSSNFSAKNNQQNGKKRKPSYRDRGWEQLTSYLSPRARKKLGDKSYKDKRDISLILDELIINHL